MFETSLVHARSRALDRRHMLLTFSIAVHSAAIAAVIAASVASTHFPVQAPKEMRPPILIPMISIPPALGTQHPAPPRPRQSAAPRVPTAPRLDIAPLTILRRRLRTLRSHLRSQARAAVRSGPPGVPLGRERRTRCQSHGSASCDRRREGARRDSSRHAAVSADRCAGAQERLGDRGMHHRQERTHPRCARCRRNFGPFQHPPLAAQRLFPSAPWPFQAEAVLPLFRPILEF